MKELRVAGCVLAGIMIGIGLHTGQSKTMAAPAASPAGITVDSVLSAYERACESINAFDISVKQERWGYIGGGGSDHHGATLAANSKPASTSTPYFRVDAPGGQPIPAHTARTRQVYSHGKFRIDVVETITGSISKGSVIIWDGASETVYNRQRADARLRSYARTNPSPFAAAYVNAYRNLDGDLSYVDLIRGRSVKAVDRKGQYIVLSAQPDPKSRARCSNIGVRLTLDPNKGFMPVEIEAFTHRNPSMPLERTKIELAEIVPGIWVPIRARRVALFWMDKNSPFYGQELGATLIEVDRAASHFNEPVDDTLFSFKLPVGTLVRDEIQNVTYRVGAESQEAYLDALARKGLTSVDALKQHNPTVRNAAVPSLVESPRRLFLWVNVAVLALLVLSVALRRWLRERQS